MGPADPGGHRSITFSPSRAPFVGGSPEPLPAPRPFVSLPLVLHEALEPLGPRGVAELAQRLGLDLADALAGHLEVLADLLEGVVALLPDAEAHAEDLLLARRQGGEHLPRLLRQVHVDDRVRRRDEGLVLDEVAEVAVLLLADGGLEGDGLLRDLQDLADLVEGQL